MTDTNTTDTTEASDTMIEFDSVTKIYSDQTVAIKDLASRSNVERQRSSSAPPVVEDHDDDTCQPDARPNGGDSLLRRHRTYRTSTKSISVEISAT